MKTPHPGPDEARRARGGRTTATRPAATSPAMADTGQPRYDLRQRLAAARLQHRNPHWHICWGYHSRRFWAFPLFGAPPGTIISAGDPARLVAMMRRAEAATATGPPASARG